MSERIASYADLAITLPAPHGSSCPCLVCADARAAIGHRPLTPGCAGAGTGDDTAENTAEAKNLVLSSAPERSGHPTARGLFSFVQSAARWQADAKRYGRRQIDGSRPWISEGSEAERCRRAFATADLLGIPVGVIVAAEEES